MTAPALELADIFRVHGPAFLTTFVDSLTTQQKKALRDISLCLTAALGGHVEQCDECGHRTISYCSCRNRHCPKCGSANRAVWLEQRADELMPVEYFHVVFTLPQSLAPLALQNQRVLYGLLFKAASETLLHARSPPASTRLERLPATTVTQSRVTAFCGNLVASPRSIRWPQHSPKRTASTQQARSQDILTT
jgi:hypothetical protein